MYSKVANLRIGELLNGLFRPPNLTDKFLGGRLISKIDTDITPFDGSNTATLGTTNLPTHSHTGNTNSTDTDHTHISYARVINFNINQGDAGGSAQGTNRSELYTTEKLTSKMKSSTVTDTGNNSTHLHSFTTNNTGSGTAFSIVPFHYRVNYLLKL
jgi:microcystin-dependent protein